MKKYTLLLIACLTFGFLNAQEENYPHVKLDKPTNQSAIITGFLTELYGPYYQQYGAPQERVDFFTEFYDRCEFLMADEIPSIVPNISSLIVKSKYNPDQIYHDNSNVFNINKFNVFKYVLNYNSSENLYYRIYETNVVLKINKKD